MKYVWKMCLAYGLLFALIWLIGWMGVVDAVTLQIAGNCAGQGTHIFTVAGGNVTGNCLNWTITNSEGMTYGEIGDLLYWPG